MTGIAALRKCADTHLNAYTDPHGPRAFATYDQQGDPDRLTPFDCLAPALLSVPIGHRQVVPLFHPAGPGATLLQTMEAVLDDEGGRSADFLNAQLDPPAGPWALVDAAIVASKEVLGVKASIVTKILHRKRPHLVPIFDKVVYRFYTGLESPPSPWGDAPRRLWAAMQADLRSQGDWLADLAAPVRASDGKPLSLLRAADIIIWEHAKSGCSR